MITTKSRRFLIKRTAKTAFFKSGDKTFANFAPLCEASFAFYHRSFMGRLPLKMISNKKILITGGAGFIDQIFANVEDTLPSSTSGDKHFANFAPTLREL
ncbi:MAG: hypothetical protein IPI93_13455 [Sphingobacteriaceae bacterium]|nr:hypothetical protein [Sphingobacteriaceae bacterium]